MKIRKMLSMALFSILVIASLFVFTGRLINAQSVNPNLDISKKLDDILKNQKTVIQGIEFLKSELNIVKIRITQQQ